MREAALAGQLLGSGVTALGRACTAHVGIYTEAFFCLSQGLERAAKLIIVADYMTTHQGTLPDNGILKRYGHDLQELLKRVDEISQRQRPGTRHCERPNSLIHQGIIETLNKFAQVTRYYNLDLLSGLAIRHQTGDDPVAAWRRHVGDTILAAHYTQLAQARASVWADDLNAAIGDATMVSHTKEDGTPVQDLHSLALHQREELMVQRWGRFYTLQIIRWLAYTIDYLAHYAAYKLRIESLAGLEEFFVMFMNDDSFLKSRRTWNIYRL